MQPLIYVVSFLDVAFLVESNRCCIVVEDEDIKHQLLIRKVQHLSLCAQWREQVSLIPGAYHMLHGWGPNEVEMESALKNLSQEHVDDEGSDDEQLNCTYDIEEEDNNNVIEETEVLAASDAYRAADNGLSFGRWDLENLWEDVEDGEESVFEATATRKRPRQK
jgi:hypothetical protein